MILHALAIRIAHEAIPAQRHYTVTHSSLANINILADTLVTRQALIAEFHPVVASMALGSRPFLAQAFFAFQGTSV